MKAKAKVFIAYAHQDTDLKEKLKRHLTVPLIKSSLEVWHDGEIKAGEEWEKDIHSNLGKADITLILVSVDLLNSEYFLDKELKKILERDPDKACIAVPIILRPCNWEMYDFSNLLALPKDGHPIDSWPNEDKVLSEIAANIKERADLLLVESNRKIQDIENELEEYIGAKQYYEAEAMLEKSKQLLLSLGVANREITALEQRLTALKKMQNLGNYLNELEFLEENKDWETAKSLLLREEEFNFSPAEVDASKKIDLINSLQSNMANTASRIRRKSEAAAFDLEATKLFARKDYEEAKKLWIEANSKDSTSERINRIRQCDELLANRVKVAAFEQTLVLSREIREKEPMKAYEMLENAVQKVKDEKLESSEEGEQVAQLLKAVAQDLDEIRNHVAVREYAILLGKGDEALREERFSEALNHFLVALEIKPEDKEQLDQKIATCQLKLSVQLLREAACEFERKKDYIREKGMYIAIRQISPDDDAAERRIRQIEEIVNDIDKEYAQTRAKGERLMLQRQYEEALAQFERCCSVKPDDTYAPLRREGALRELDRFRRNENTRTHFNDGRESFKRNQFWRSRGHFQKALKYAPNDEEIRLQLSKVNQMLWAEGLFSAKLFGPAKKAYLKLPDDLRNLAFVEQRIKQCERKWKTWAGYTWKVAKWIVGLGLLGLLVWVIINNKHNNKKEDEQRVKKFEQANKTGDSLMLALQFKAASHSYNEALKYASNLLDSSYVKKRILQESILLTSLEFADQALARKTIPMLDSAITTLQLSKDSLNLDATDVLYCLIDDKITMLTSVGDSIKNKDSLESLRALLKKGNSGAEQNFDTALAAYELAKKQYGNLISKLSSEERSQVRNILEWMDAKINIELKAVNAKIYSISKKLGNLLTQKKRNELNTEKKGLKKYKERLNYQLARARNLAPTFVN